MPYTHTCKCGAQYQSDDEEPYFCPPCIAERKRIAAEIDAKQPPRGPKPMSDLERYDAARKVHGFPAAGDIL